MCVCVFVSESLFGFICNCIFICFILFPFLYLSLATYTERDTYPNVALPPGRTKGYTEDEKRLAKKMMRYWANFARTGDPNRHPEGPITSDWPVYTPNGKEFLTLDTGDRKIIGKGKKAPHLHYFRRVLVSL